MTIEKAYYCEDCDFLFLRIGTVHECPLCEGPHFRLATEEESDRLQQILETRRTGKPVIEQN